MTGGGVAIYMGLREIGGVLVQGVFQPKMKPLHKPSFPGEQDLCNQEAWAQTSALSPTGCVASELMSEPKSSPL